MAGNTPNFQSIPWVAALLRDNAFITTAIPSRTVKSTTEDSFFSTTLNSPSTISQCLLQYRHPSPSATRFSRNAIPTNEIRIFCTLGSDLNGYPGVLHGGMVATLLDECMGLILSLSLGGGEPGMEGPVTAYLNTRFIEPVSTPGTVMVSGRITEAKENRKWKIEGDIKDENGTVLAEADCLYILPRKPNSCCGAMTLNNGKGRQRMKQQ
ncbi:HotDog domain-containing protein [Aspergillus californicus]